MRRLRHTLFAVSLIALLVSACGRMEPAPKPAPAPSRAIPTVPIEQPTQVPVRSTNGTLFAPSCPYVSASCTPPEVTDTLAEDTFCVNKIPYQLVLVGEGITFEVLDPEKLTCVDNGVIVDGKHALECSGAELWTTEVMLTNVACGSNRLATNTDRCQEGFGYDATQNCCAPVTSDAGNSITINVNMGACPAGVTP